MRLRLSFIFLNSARLTVPYFVLNVYFNENQIVTDLDPRYDILFPSGYFI